MKITTPEEWWTAVEERWDHLLAMIERYHPTAQPVSPDPIELPITAANPERACQLVRREIAKEEQGLPSPGERAAKAKEAKDHAALGTILSGTWFGIPESVGCWELPSFGVLCDLCSEDWVFEDELA